MLVLLTGPRWAAAKDQFVEIHYDQRRALSSGLPGVILQGNFKLALLAQMLGNWIGFEGTLKKASIQQRGMDEVDNALTRTGRVIKKYVQDDEHYVECDIRIENQKGERTAVGNAVVTLPSNNN